MARFDVYPFQDEIHLVDIQADLLDDLPTRAVLPLVPKNDAPEHMRKLTPEITLFGKPFVLLTMQIGTIEASRLGEAISNIEQDYRQSITEAVDFLFQGYA